ncbi:MAG: polysaccharide deacetylase family protein [Gemmatimonadetes bacterium]|nr:polysaccharide deacetylase family protein [Gemmatimonadota bacterium]
MLSVCAYFQVHQPCRLRAFRVFDIGESDEYFDEAKDRQILQRVAERCYRPMNRLLLDLIKQHEGRFRVAFSLSGTVLEQLERFEPDTLKTFQDLAATGCVEFLGETYYHSLAFVHDLDEFDEQVARHSDAIERWFGTRPTVFRNTELIYSDAVAHHVAQLGFEAVLCEGADRVLGWRSPTFVRQSPGPEQLPLLLKDYRLSDDIAFRFGDQGWHEYPLQAETFARWVNAKHGNGDVVNLFMDYETFGEHQWASTGIFEFMAALPARLLAHPDTIFQTPSEVIRSHRPAGALSVPDFVSWADIERDLTAWLGNDMQWMAARALYALRGPVLATADPVQIERWRQLTTSDHFYYMCTKWFADGDVHKYFNPFESPYDAYIAFMNILSDLSTRVGARHAESAHA